MLLILPLPERGIASLGQTVNNEKWVYECGRISIGCSGNLVGKTQCHIEQRESSRGVKKRGRGWLCCVINVFFFLLLILPLPERGIASLGQTVYNKKGASKCGRINIGCSGRSVGKTQCHIEKRESSRGVKKWGRGGLCCVINVFFFLPDPNCTLSFTTPLLFCICLFRSV